MDAHIDELAEIALGWLGWSEEQTLFSDINAILIAYNGLVQRLNAEKGIAPTNTTPTPTNPTQITVGGGRKPTLTPAAFDAIFRTGVSKSGVAPPGKNPKRR